MRSLSSLLLLSFLCGLTGVSANGGINNLIVNGGFELPALSYGSYQSITAPGGVPGWTDVSGCGIEVQNHIAGDPFEGAQFLEVMSNCPSNVHQNVPTVHGQLYTLSFSFSPRPNIASNKVNVYFGDNLIGALDGHGITHTVWTTKQYPGLVAGPGLTTKLRFQGLSPGSTGGYFDNMILTTDDKADKTPPVITGKSKYFIHVNSPVTYATLDVKAELTETDNVELSSLGIVCNHDNDYPLGTTEVDCTASDVSGNVGHFAVTVHVIQDHPGGYGDPQFLGFNSQNFQVHGTSDTVYNVLSTPHLQYNAFFRYLESGRCRKGTACFSHPGNYFGSVGMKVRDESQKVNDIVVEAGSVLDGLRLFYNNATLPVSDTTISFGSYTIQHPNQFEVVLESDEFNIKVSNSDMFLNQEVSIGSGLLSRIAEYKKAMKSGNDARANEIIETLPHGILGQTWNTATYNNRWKHIQGQLYDYVINDGILGTEFKYNKF
jgi:hypothetical protein